MHKLSFWVLIVPCMFVTQISWGQYWSSSGSIVFSTLPVHIGPVGPPAYDFSIDGDVSYKEVYGEATTSSFSLYGNTNTTDGPYITMHGKDEVGGGGHVTFGIHSAVATNSNYEFSTIVPDLMGNASKTVLMDMKIAGPTSLYYGNLDADKLLWNQALITTSHAHFGDTDSASSYRLHIFGSNYAFNHVYMNKNFYLNADAYAINYFTTSDQRFKKNIVPIGDIQNKLFQLTPKKYFF